MSTAIAARSFGGRVAKLAQSYLSEIATGDQARHAAGRLALALRHAAAVNERIYECDPASVAEAVAMSALTGLMPGGPVPDVHLIPRRIRGVQRLQWQISFRGLRRLVERAGYRLTAVPVGVADKFVLRRGLDRVLEHEPDIDNPPTTWDELRGVYVVAHDGQERLIDFEWMPKKLIETRRARSDAWQRGQSGGSSPWASWPVEMAIKTAILYAVRRGLVGLDDVGKVAMQADGEQDAIVDVETEAVTPAPRPAGAPPTGTAGLRAALAAPEPTVEVVVGQPAVPEPMTAPVTAVEPAQGELGGMP